MEVLELARIQFASTTIFHYFFVPVSVGLAFLIAIMQTIYTVTGNEEYKKMTKFWGTLFLINFAVGVVTGILQEFQFGMNWSTYSRFVGRSEEHTSELQSRGHLVCRLLLEKNNGD